MEPSQSLLESADHRLCRRMNLSRKILVELKNGALLECLSKNVSLGGVLVSSKEFPPGCRAGMDAKIYLDSDLHEGFQCRVARISQGLIGLAVDRKEAAKFGKALTRGLFSRKC